MPTLKEYLDLGSVLEKKAQDAANEKEAATLKVKKALVDFDAFKTFKAANFVDQGLTGLGRGLGWGVGLGIPAVGAGHFLLNDAKHQAEDTIDYARNQALLAAAVNSGGNILANLVKGMNNPKSVESTLEETYPSGDVYKLLNTTKVSADKSIDLFKKLAAVIALDDVLEKDAETDPNAREKLLLNREVGANILRELLQ